MQGVWQDDIDPDNMTYEVCYVTLSGSLAFSELHFILIEFNIVIEMVRNLGLTAIHYGRAGMPVDSYNLKTILSDFI